MIAADLFHDPERRRFGVMPESDPLTEPDALQEAVLVDVRFNSVVNSVGLLFDLRNALQFQAPDAMVAVLIARGLRSLSWPIELDGRPRSWMVALSSELDPSAGTFRFRLGFVSQPWLTLESGGAEFFVGEMDGVDAAPPDYGEDDDVTVRLGMPSWESRFAPSAATFLDPQG